MDPQRLEVTPLPQPLHRLTRATPKLVRTPLPRAGGEDLKRVAPKPVGSFSGILDAVLNRGMDPDAPRSSHRRLLRRRPLQRIFLGRAKNGHVTHSRAGKSWCQ